MNKVLLFFLFFLISSYSLFSEEIAPNVSQEVQHEVSSEPGYHEHDGFYFRFLFNPFIGYGYIHSSQNLTHADNSDLIMTNSYQFGYSINKNMILYIGTIFIGLPPFVNPLNLLPKAINPYAQRGTLNSDVAFIAGITGGINYYFNPQNIYISFELGFHQGGISKNNINYHWDEGFGIQTSIGKEWWTDKNWGLGLALNIFYDYFPKTRQGDAIITSLHAFAIGLSFSATYN